MTAHALMYVDKDTFYRFIANADDQYRYEYVRGWIMQQQAGGTIRHARIAARVFGYLLQRTDQSIWSVMGSDAAADTGHTFRYADVIVELLGASDDKAIATQTPVVVVEVLSPSSEERDLSVKVFEYTGLASLDTYIVASQDEALCYVWQRRADGTFAAQPDTVKGRDQIIQVPALGIAIPLAEIYRGIDV